MKYMIALLAVATLVGCASRPTYIEETGMTVWPSRQQQTPEELQERYEYKIKQYEGTGCNYWTREGCNDPPYHPEIYYRYYPYHVPQTHYYHHHH